MGKVRQVFTTFIQKSNIYNVASIISLVVIKLNFPYARQLAKIDYLKPELIFQIEINNLKKHLPNETLFGRPSSATPGSHTLGAQSQSGLASNASERVGLKGDPLKRVCQQPDGFLFHQPHIHWEAPFPPSLVPNTFACLWHECRMLDERKERSSQKWAEAEWQEMTRAIMEKNHDLLFENYSELTT